MIHTEKLERLTTLSHITEVHKFNFNVMERNTTKQQETKSFFKINELKKLNVNILSNTVVTHKDFIIKLLSNFGTYSLTRHFNLHRVLFS